MWLRSGVAVAVAVASSCSSNLTPNLGTSICCRCGPKKKKKKGKGLRALQTREQYEEPLRSGNEPSRKERGNCLAWSGDVCRVS